MYFSDQDLILLKIAQIASTGSLLRLVGIVLGNLQFSGWCVPKRGEFPPIIKFIYKKEDPAGGGKFGAISTVFSPECSLGIANRI